MSVADMDLQKMVRGFRVSDLQSLLIFAGRNKAGKKTELQARALDLIKLHSQPIDMKIRELYNNRFHTNPPSTSEPPDLFSSEMYSQGLNNPIGNTYSNISGHKPSLLSNVPNYISSLNHHSLLRQVPPLPQYPVNPDVKFKDLPFYDVLNELLKPTSLIPTRDIVQEKELIFYLGPQDLKELDSNTDVQVQFRIGCLEMNKDQEDDIPTSVCLKVNQLVATLPNPLPNVKPGTEPKRPRKPIDITNCIKHSTTEPQTVCVSWATNTNVKPYIAGVFLVRKQTSSVLIKRLKDIGVRNPDHTTAMIKEKLCHDRDSEIATMSLRGSLTCPLGKIKMSLPCRALSCTHLQCFDAALYIQMNEKKPKWICPVCDKPAVFKQLAIDGLFLDITSKAPADCNEVQFHENGSWTPVMPVKKVPEITEATLQVPKVENPKPKKQKVEVVDLDSGSDTDTQDSWPIQPPKKKPFKPAPGLSVILQNPSSDLSSKSYLYQPSSSKSVPSSSKSGVVSEEKTLSSQLSTNFSFLSTSKNNLNFEVEASSPAFSPESPDPQGSASTTFQETVDILNNPPSSSTAGQCSYEFDLYSFMQQNNEDVYQYQGNAPPEEPEDTPDVIDID